jgi:hypothetical protein
MNPRELSGDALLDAYERTSGEGSEAEELLREIERRQLDF